LWGIYYDYAGGRVFDVERRLLIDNEFYELNRYWGEMEERWSESVKNKVAPNPAVEGDCAKARSPSLLR